MTEVKDIISNSIDKISDLDKTNKNPFPLDVFPVSLQEVILDANEKSNFPIDYTASGMLFAVAVAAGNQYKIDTCNTWEDKPIVFMALVGEAGANKSHPLEFALKPLLEKDEESYKVYSEQMEVFKNTPKDEKESEPILKMLLCEDATIEAIVKNHSLNPCSLGLYMDEITGFIKGFTRYDKSGSAVNKYLSAWSGKALSVSRIGSGETRVYNTCLSVIGTTQPDRLHYFCQSELVDSGFLDRMLFCYPDNTKQVALPWKGTEPINDSEYRVIINNLLVYREKWLNDKESLIVRFSEEAKIIGKEFTDRIHSERLGTDDKRIKGIYIKFENHFFRIVLLLWLIHWASSNTDKVGGETGNLEGEITPDILEKAIRLTRYFIINSLKVNEEQFHSFPSDDLKGWKRALYDLLPNETFKRQEALSLAEQHSIDVSIRSIDEFLKNRKLFEKLNSGYYLKK